MVRIKAPVSNEVPVTKAVLKKAIALGKKWQREELQATSVRYLPDIQSLLISLREQGAVILPIREFAELAALHISIMGLIASSESLLKIATKVIVARHGISLNKGLL